MKKYVSENYDKISEPILIKYTLMRFKVSYEEVLEYINHLKNNRRIWY